MFHSHVSRFSLIRIALATAMLLGLANCAKSGGTDSRGQYAPGLSDDSSSTVVVQNSSSSNSASAPIVQCGVSVSSDVVAPGQVISITVTATGGYAPYKLNTTTDYGRFSSTQTISGSYTNTTSSNRIVEKLFSVVDNNGNAGNCFFRVTVLPSGSGVPTSNACSLSANPSSPGINSFFNLTIAPTVTSSPFILRSLQLQNDWILTPNITASNALVYQVKYTSLGARTLNAVIERNGVQSSCSLSLVVGSTPSSTPTPTPNPTGPSVAISVSPANRQLVGSTFTLSTTLSNFAASPAPTFQVASNDQTISILPSNGVYLITGNGTPRVFNITVTASQGLIVATNSIQLEYYANGGGTTPTPTPVPNAPSCSLVAQSGQLAVGQLFQMTISNNSSSEPLLISGLDAGLNSIVTSGAALPMQMRFTTPGIRTVRVFGARLLSTGALCNGTGELSIAVNVISTLSTCDAVFSPQVSLAGTVIRAAAVLQNSIGNGPFETSIESNNANFKLVKVLGPLEAMVRFNKPGSYPMTMRVRDLSSGSTATCQTVHQVIPADTFVVAQDEPGQFVRMFKGPLAQEILRPGGFAPFADVLPNFRGGNRVATADINGDGVVDIIVAAGYNGGLRVRAFNGTNLALMRDFMAFAGLSTGMNRTYIAAGDVDADGFADIVVGSGCNANASRVEVYSGRTGQLVTRFNADTRAAGVRVAVGDVNGDGYSDVVTSSCSVAEIRGFSGRDIAQALPLAPFINFNAYPGVNTNVKVATGDVNGDGYADIITGTNGSNTLYNKIFSGNPAHNLSLLYSLRPFAGQCGINFVAAGDVNGDGLADVIVGGDGTVQREEVKIFNSSGFYEIVGPSSPVGSLVPFPTGSNERLYVGGGAGGL